MIRSVTTFAAALVAATALTGPAFAGDVTVSDAWARASAGMAKAGAAFMMIANKGTADDRLVAASADVSKKTELHTHIKDGEVMKMRRVEGGIPVPAGGMAMLKPGSYHVMFMGLHAPLKEGTMFPITLEFEKAGKVTVQAHVKGVGAMGAGKMGHDMKHMKH